MAGILRMKGEVLHCQGQLAHSFSSYDTQYPILLHKEQYITHLIIWSYHKHVLQNVIRETCKNYDRFLDSSRATVREKDLTFLESLPKITVLIL